MNEIINELDHFFLKMMRLVFMEHNSDCKIFFSLLVRTNDFVQTIVVAHLSFEQKIATLFSP